MAKIEKIKTTVTNLFRSRFVSFENYCQKILASKLSFIHIPLLRTLLFIFWMPFTSVDPNPSKCGTKPVLEDPVSGCNSVSLHL